MAILQLENLSMRFGGLAAVNRCNLAVEAGQIFAIIGPNGAGKTTVFNAITGIYEPSEGSVRFEGRFQRSRYTHKVLIACFLIGVATAATAAVTSVNVDKLWHAAVKRNFLDPTKPFSYAAALRDAGGYLRGELAVEKLRGNRWAVVTADGTKSLSQLATEEDAGKLKAELTEMIALAASNRTIEEHDGKWAVLSADRSRRLASFDTRDAAVARLATLAGVGRDQLRRRRTAWIAFFAGLVLGSSGAYTVWNRSRRTPDVISRGGIARTFQGIRLFQNMTVVENVLVGMDRSFRAGVVRMMLQTPGTKRELGAGIRRAMELLGFVGLAAKAQMLAKNLPYGDQRRLEIARALATRPRLLLLDEPAAGMNPAETAELMDLIRRIRDSGITVLLIEHHMNVVMDISDRIAVLDYGTKIAEGTPAEVRANPKVIEAYLGKEEVT